MIDLPIALGGFIVGTIVGLTGVGGGALMTPMLVLVFGVQPLAAVSSDVVAAVIMKPIGGGVHLRRGTVKLGLAKWLMVGSLPCAFLGVLLLKHFAAGPALQQTVKTGLGWALLLASTGIVARPLLARRRHAPVVGVDVPVRIIPTILVGAFGGLVVGMTSVGSGSLMIVLLLLLYPQFRLADLVGTDLVQAIPLVASAALGHLLLGDFKLALTSSILVGAIPGVYLGARVSSRAPDGLLRPILVIALSSSAFKLLGVSNAMFPFAVAAVVLVVLAFAVPDVKRRLAARREAKREAEAVPVASSGATSSSVSASGAAT
ncbi:MAG TPA: sulfite exporter TauE/SafE family protein [Polyangia bacterium]|nr:sulfite exporter TauE/SafE family protein [Polyangia bacterium]